MKIHNCLRCGYETNLKNSYKNHLARKRQCKPKLSDIPLSYLQESFDTFLSNNKKQPMIIDYPSILPIENVSTVGYLYMIREREFIKTGEKIYKVGKTTQEIHKRLCKYPKNSELILAIKFQNCHKSETELLRVARIQLKQRRDIGLEYFEGDEHDIMKLFYQLT